MTAAGGGGLRIRSRRSSGQCTHYSLATVSVQPKPWLLGGWFAQGPRSDVQSAALLHLTCEAARVRRDCMVGAKLLQAIHFGKARTTLGNPSSDTSPALTASCRVVRPM